WGSSGNTIPYWRPFTKLSWLVEAQIWGHERAAPFHLTGVLWHAVGAVAVGWLGRCIGVGPVLAAAAGVAYGLHPAPMEPVSLLMARSDVTAMTASVLALAGWWRWRHRRGAAWVHVLPLCIAVASKETSVVLAPALTVVTACEVYWQRIDRRQALRLLIPAWSIVVLALGMRHLVMAGRGGAALQIEPLRLLVGGGRYLIAALPLRIETGLGNMPLAFAATPGVWLPATFAWLAAAGALIVAFRARAAAAVMLLMWGMATVMPVLIVEQMNVPSVAGKFPLADRWVIGLVGATTLLAALAVQRLMQPRWRHGVAGLVAVWALGMLAIAPAQRALYASELTLLDLEDRSLSLIPAAFHSTEDRCRAIDRQIVRHVAAGQWQGVTTARVAATAAGCPPDFDRDFNHLSALVSLQRWPEAHAKLAPMQAASRRDTRHRATLAYLAGRIHLGRGHPMAAVAAFDRAEKWGLGDCALPARRAMALRQALQAPTAAGGHAAGSAVTRGRHGRAAADLQRHDACLRRRGQLPAPTILLLAAESWAAAGRPADSQRALARARRHPGWTEAMERHAHNLQKP
ncbi:MAG: hypothetical protein KC502_15105, partial [Myxococcales bacterium]|nr:hypothetical protein [Myxococcales bacterium]